MSVYTTNEIADKVRPIAEAYGIDKVYLFGSYARGEATENSDIDFYVEFSKPLGYAIAVSFPTLKKVWARTLTSLQRTDFITL